MARSRVEVCLLSASRELITVNFTSKLHLTSTTVNNVSRFIFASHNSLSTCTNLCSPPGERTPRRRDTLNQFRSANTFDRRAIHGRAAAPARASANQSGREGITGRIQQSADDSPQSGRIHPHLYLYLPQRRPRKAAEEHDRQPRPRQTHLARARRKYRKVRVAVRIHQGGTGSRPANRRFCTVSLYSNKER